MGETNGKVRASIRSVGLLGFFLGSHPRKAKPHHFLSFYLKLLLVVFNQYIDVSPPAAATSNSIIPCFSLRACGQGRGQEARFDFSPRKSRRRQVSSEEKVSGDSQANQKLQKKEN